MKYIKKLLKNKKIVAVMIVAATLVLTYMSVNPTINISNVSKANKKALKKKYEKSLSNWKKEYARQKALKIGVKPIKGADDYSVLQLVAGTHVLSIKNGKVIKLKHNLTVKGWHIGSWHFFNRGFEYVVLE